MKKRLVAMLLLLAFCLPALFSCTTAISMNNIADDFLTLLCERNFSGMFEYFWKYSTSGTAEDFEENYLSVLNSLGAEKITVKDRKVSLENETQFLSYTVCYETKKAGTIENACQVRIISDGDGLHLEYSPSLILADYEEGDRVSIITLPGRRGEIFTSDGTVIASNDYAETVYIQVDSELNIAGTISSLTDQLELSDEEAQSIKKKYDSALENNYAHVIVKAFVKGRLTSAQKEALEGIEGVGIDTDSMTLQRYYPYGKIFCHITGYTSAPSEEEAAALAEKGFPNATLVGKDGLEKTYDEVLQGRDGYRVQLSTKDGQFKSVICEQPAENGQDLHLSVSSRLQQKAYYQMASTFQKEQTGTSIVLNAKTGFVEAMVSFPCYDPNLFTGGISKEDYAALTSEESNQPLYPRATMGLYPPGSLFKPFSIVPALEKGVITKDSVFPYKIVDNKWTPPETWIWPPVGRNDETKTTGPLDLDEAMKQSDNIYFSWAALLLGEEDFMAHMEKLGIGEKMPFELNISKSNLLNEGTEMNRKLLTDMSFGQGELLLPPIQIAAMYTAFQNNGDVLLPKLVSEIKKTEGSQYVTTQTMEREVYKSGIMKESTINTLIPTLKDVVNSGTAKSIKIEGLTLAAKTGTAIKGSDKTQKTSWLVAWWEDQEESRLALCMVDGPREMNDYKHRIVKALLTPDADGKA